MIYQNIITPRQLKEKLDKKEPIFIVDTRESDSVLRPVATSVHIPSSEILQKTSNLPKNKTIVICCTHGVDSFFLMNLLVSDYGFRDVYSLKSGIEGWHKFFGLQVETSNDCCENQF